MKEIIVKVAKLSPLVREFQKASILPFALSLSKGGFMVRQAHHERTGKRD
jgi:hypothetical protein